MRVVYFPILMLRAGAWTNVWRSGLDLMSHLRTEISEIEQIDVWTGVVRMNISTGVREMRRSTRWLGEGSGALEKRRTTMRSVD